MGFNHVLAFQGFGESIPPFLRFDGPVKNKKPSKKEVVNLLKDAWKERIAEEQVSSHYETLLLQNLRSSFRSSLKMVGNKVGA